jgi:hypothetical protein
LFLHYAKVGKIYVSELWDSVIERTENEPPFFPLQSYRVVDFISILFNIKNQQKIKVENCYNVKKVGEEMKVDEKLIKEIEEFDNAFPNGIFAIPRNPKDPRVKVRALRDYCDSKGVKPKDLTEEEMKQFLVY